MTDPRPAGPELFDATPWLVEPDNDEPLSADRRRTLRQRNDIALGRHPLAGAPIHAQAPADAAPGDRSRPFTCGTCTHRTRRRGYPKCDLAPDTHGGGTDLRLWWPACTQYNDTPASGDA
ncbi:hypothetical protein [Phycicoccus avicenniae]|uniref:hypothetical protein n=1 Tax=Phycicoccus avicenniae TaxID=2828860 RepID=UPI003D2C46E6